jgi:hypothetical protein
MNTLGEIVPIGLLSDRSVKSVLAFSFLIYYNRIISERRDSTKKEDEVFEAALNYLKNQFEFGD